MTGVSEILAELDGRGVRIEFRQHGGVRLVPARLIDPPLLDCIRAHKTELLARLHAEREEAKIDRLTRAGGRKSLPPPSAPAYSIIGTCKRHGVALRIDENGALVVEKDGAKGDQSTDPWPTLLMAIEAHLADVVTLVGSGWTLTANIPKTSASA
jgi:hypothetical protein